MDPAYIVPAVIGAIWGATEVLRRAVARKRRNGRNGQEKGLNVEHAPAGLMDTAYWRKEIRMIVHDEVRPVVSELQRCTEDLGKILGMIDPSGHTPRGGRRAQRE
jgi:hypothetical protein